MAVAALDEAAAAGPHAHVHTITQAGHWIHVDALDALIDVMASSFK